MVQYIIRTVIIIATGGVAAAVPNLEAFISLVGAIFFSILGKLKSCLELNPNSLSALS